MSLVLISKSNRMLQKRAETKIVQKSAYMCLSEAKINGKCFRKKCHRNKRELLILLGMLRVI